MTARPDVRAAVPGIVRELIAGRAPAAEVLVLEDLDDLTQVDFVVPHPFRAAELPAQLVGAERVSVVQTLSAGVDSLADGVPEQITLCSARGARDAPVAEWVLGALLGATTQLLARAPARSWERGMTLADLSESTVVIVGMGSIGEALAAMLQALGTEVVGVVHRARDGRRGIDELDELLPGADAVVLLTPLTDETEHLIDARRLALMADGTVLVNAARGAIVDTDALVAETRSGRLRAVLDVTDPEPLPDRHPLWDAAGVLSITPHIAGNSPRGNRQAAELAGDQLARFCAGEPLHNIVRQGSS